MPDDIPYTAVSAFLLAVLIASLVLAIRGSTAAKSFLWAWAGLLAILLPFAERASVTSTLPIGLMLAFLIYVLIAGKLQSIARLEASHEETRRVLAESNRRIDEERRTISRRLHDQVNPNLLLCKSELRRLESILTGNPKAVLILTSVQKLIGETYTQIRDIIKNTRIEVIDSIGFTAAVESLISHYTNFFDKPAILLDHDLPKRPNLEEDVAITGYKILREAIYNAIKHANAKHISVSLKMNLRDRRIDIVVTDDGIGLDARTHAKGEMDGGIGLIDMRERARVIGANLKIEPALPADRKRPGTRISFSISTRLS
ncbi:MAG: hypothetical protein KF778_14255 [Rhodocyclaceae bacterium]|nr:hypothetical protein [Rhodocyclaceae bacterium]